MASIPGGTAVKRGYYIDGRHFEFANVEHDGGTLPGPPERRWLYMPTLAVVAAAPALGGLFVLTLPFIGFGLLAYAIARKLAGAARTGARELGATLAPELRPGEAYLTGKAEKDEGEGAPPNAPDADLDALQKDVEDARRRRE